MNSDFVFCVNTHHIKSLTSVSPQSVTNATNCFCVNFDEFVGKVLTLALIQPIKCFQRMKFFVHKKRKSL